MNRGAPPAMSGTAVRKDSSRAFLHEPWGGMAWWYAPSARPCPAP